MATFQKIVQRFNIKGIFKQLIPKKVNDKDCQWSEDEKEVTIQNVADDNYFFNRFKGIFYVNKITIWKENDNE